MKSWKLDVVTLVTYAGAIRPERALRLVSCGLPFSAVQCGLYVKAPCPLLPTKQ